MNRNNNQAPGCVAFVIIGFFILFPVSFAITWVTSALRSGAPVMFLIPGIAIPGMMVLTAVKILMAMIKFRKKSDYDLENLPDEPDPWDEDFEQKIDEYRLKECGHVHHVNDEEHGYGETNFCPYCGTRVENNHRFCKQCGREI